MVPLKYLLLATLLFSPALAVKVFDLAGVFGNYPCMKQAGFEHSIIRAYHSYGAIDVDAPENIRQSNQAGLSTDVYMFPCRGKNATIQVNELIVYLNKIADFRNTSSMFDYQAGTIWLDIETNPSTGCSWGQGTPDSNCQFTRDLIGAIEANGRAVGVYASGYMWNQIYGGKEQCAVFGAYPLWYAHYDGKEDFGDWEANKFGGWSRPTIKQFAGDSPECGFKVDLSFF